MKDRNPFADIDAPEWFREELSKAQPPAQDILDKLEPLRETFMQALRPKAPERSAGTADAVLDALGRLKRVAGDIAGQAFSLPPRAPAYAATRGVASAWAPRPPGGERAVAKLAKSAEGLRVEVTTYQTEESGGVEIEVNAFDTERGVEARPMTVEVRDQAGAELAPLAKAGPTDQPPRYPDPAPGVYCFAVSSGAKRAELRLEIVEG